MISDSLFTCLGFPISLLCQMFPFRRSLFFKGKLETKQKWSSSISPTSRNNTQFAPSNKRIHFLVCFLLKNIRGSFYFSASSTTFLHATLLHTSLLHTLTLTFHAPSLNLRSAVTLLNKTPPSFSHLHLYHQHFIFKVFPPGKP